MSELELFDPGSATIPLTLTQAAVGRLRDLYAKQQPGKQFRVYITGGGCSGFQYGFTFDNQQLEDDLPLHQDGVDFVVDGLSLQYLEGAQIDFEDNLMGARFRVHNPNSTTTCSCGASFSV